MNADPVTDILEDMQLSAAHAVTEHIAGMAVDDHLAGVHGIADVVLAVILDHDGGAVHEGRQVIARNSLNGYGDRTVDAVADVILAVDVGQLDLFGAGSDRRTDLLVQVPII